MYFYGCYILSLIYLIVSQENAYFKGSIIAARKDSKHFKTYFKAHFVRCWKNFNFKAFFMAKFVNFKEKFKFYLKKNIIYQVTDK